MTAGITARATVLVFDGDCAFCTTAVGWMRRLLPAMPDASPYQWTDLPALGLTEADARSRVWLVDSAGHRHGGAAAVSTMLRHQPAPGLRFLGWLGSVPPWSWAAEAGYRVVARNRHRLPGGTPACRMKPAE